MITSDQHPLLENLNPAQQAAVTHSAGPAIVMAGAGSGKTKVLTTRVAWLLTELHQQPDQIMLVTFTNKAAQEMNKRVEQLTGTQLNFSGTFHRLAARILRRDGYHIDVSPDYTIYDSDDQLSLIKQIYKEHGFDVKKYNPKAIKAEISNAKNELITAEEFEKLAINSYQEFVARVYKNYDAALRNQQAVDFDDLLLLTLKLLTTSKPVLEKYQSQINHVLVDEYQDTNKAQYQLTKLFTKPSDNVFVVGDFAQSIYAWRGADYRNMMQLGHDFEGIQEYKLEQNYRSTQTILDAATAVITQTTAHPVLKLWTDNPAKDKITLIEAQSGEEEATKILQKIRLHRQTGQFTYDDMVILYRTNAQSRSFEEAFVKAGIPYRLVGGFKFYERKEIKDVLAYLRLYLNPQDSVSRERLAKLGKRKLAEFEAWCERTKTATPVTTDSATTTVATSQPLEILKNILDVTKYLETFDKNDPEDVSRLENVQELLNVAAQFEHIAVFLENVALVQDDYLADAENSASKNAVTMMSLHSAKGLEYPIVFMVGMEEGLLPHSRSFLDKDQMEEERRLCYVGITRAKEKLYLSFAKQRWIYGTRQYSLRSRFLNDIPTELLEVESSDYPEYGSEYEFSDYERPSSFNNYNKWGQRSTPKPPPKPAGRHIVFDDNELEAVLSGDIDIKSFLEN